MPWDPALYHHYGIDRAAPFDDLVRLIGAREGMSALDLGCGDGALTARLADRLPGSTVLGIDSAPAMIAAARHRVRPGLSFRRQTIQDVDGAWDLVFSHAALQWVPDHRALIPRLAGMLRPRGQLVVQMPANHAQTAHQLLRKTAAEAPYADALGGWQRPLVVLALEDYARLLYDAGLAPVTVFAKVYPTELPDAAALLGWMRGTALVPYLDRLPAALHASFLARFGERLRTQWPGSPILHAPVHVLLAATRP